MLSDTTRQDPSEDESIAIKGCLKGSDALIREFVYEDHKRMTRSLEMVINL